MRRSGSRNLVFRASGLAALLVVLAAPARADAAIAERFPASGEIVPMRVAVRAEPSPTASRIAVLTQFRSDFRLRIVMAVGSTVGEDGRTWYEVSLPGRPNGRTGWVSARYLALRPTNKEIVIDRSARWLELRQRAKVVLRARVAVGKPGMETPLGFFYVTAKFVPTAHILGAYAFETSAYSKLSDWPGGGVVGIHGTPSPWLLGQAVSHGCVRVHNANILKLRRLVPVGTPIRIVA